MKTIIAITMLVAIVGCAHGVDVDNSDAGLDDALTETLPQQPFCCQVDKNITDGQFWQNGLYSCSPSEPPWICGSNMSCDDPGCRSNMPCEAFNGSGVVVQCPTDQ
jgi:hypothetical protein